MQDGTRYRLIIEGFHMLTSIRGLVAASLVAGCAVAATPAFADSPVSVSASASIVSEYRFRGVGLSNGDPTLQGSITVSHSSGFYVSAWGSSIDPNIPTAGIGSTEIDVYGGWSGNVTSALKVDAGVYYYAYPNSGPGKFDIIELYGSVSGDLGPASAKIGVNYAPKQSSLASGGFKRDNTYVYGELGIAIPNTPVSLLGHLGYTSGQLTFTNDRKALDWLVSASFAVSPHVSVSAAYVGVQHDVTISNVTKDAVVGTLSVSF